MGLRKLFGVDHDPWPDIVVNDDSWSETEDGWRSSVSELPIVTNRRQQEAVRAAAAQWYDQEWHRWGRQ